MSVIPQVGMGASEQVGSDRYPYTIIEVVSDRKIVVRADAWRITSGSEHDGSARYIFSANPHGTERTLTLRKNGRWCQQRQGMRESLWGIGNRSRYYDPSF